jgi:hypothetical protein
MDKRRFDAWTKSFTLAGSRRTLLRVLTIAVPGLMLAGSDDSDAKKKRKQKRRQEQTPPPAASPLPPPCQSQDLATTCGGMSCGLQADNCGRMVDCGRCQSANRCVAGLCECNGGAPCGPNRVCCGGTSCKAPVGGACFGSLVDCCSPAVCHPTQFRCCFPQGTRCSTANAFECCSGMCNIESGDLFGDCA